MSHATLKQIDRSLHGNRREAVSDSCDFCGANELKRNVGYAGCIYCRRGGERTGPIGRDEVPTCTTAFWIASKEKHWPGGFSAFCKHFNLDEAEYRKEAMYESV